jgi:hypothetical protein
MNTEMPHQAHGLEKGISILGPLLLGVGINLFRVPNVCLL